MDQEVIYSQLEHSHNVQISNHHAGYQHCLKLVYSLEGYLNLIWYYRMLVLQHTPVFFCVCEIYT